jgi:hypothetical protein
MRFIRRNPASALGEPRLQSVELRRRQGRREGEPGIGAIPISWASDFFMVSGLSQVGLAFVQSASGGSRGGVRAKVARLYFLLSAERPVAGVGDHHPDNPQLSPADAYCAGLCGRQAVADESREQFSLEAVGEHHCFGTAVRTTGEQP